MKKLCLGIAFVYCILLICICWLFEHMLPWHIGSKISDSIALYANDYNRIAFKIFLAPYHRCDTMGKLFFSEEEWIEKLTNNGGGDLLVLSWFPTLNMKIAALQENIENWDYITNKDEEITAIYKMMR